MDFKTVLNKIADELPTAGLKRIPVLSADKWILASGLQKCVRRGDTRLAASFAQSLAHQDRRMLWRRLLVIVFEDVANPELVQAVVAAYKLPILRREIGDTELAVYLARKMALSPKSRFITEMLTYTLHAKQLAKARKSMEKAKNRRLGTIILDLDKLLPERFLALWMLAGTRAYPASSFSRVGDIETAARVLRELSVPSELTEACIAVLHDMQWPLALYMPLAQEVLDKERANLRIHEERPLSSPKFEGVPMFAVDGLYTRIGIASARQLQKTIPALRGYTPAQLGEGLFFIESENIDRRMTSDSLDRFREDSIFALMEGLGLNRDEYATLRRCLTKHFDVFNEIRLEQFERSQYGAQKGLFSDKEE